MLIVNKNLQVPLKELKFSYSRSPGPGGQNVNKVNTKVTLKWPVHDNTSLPETVRARLVKKYNRRISKMGELLVTSHRFRDQGRNVADCLNKLREMISTVAVEPKKRKTKKVSKASKARRLQQKRRTSERKKSRRSPKFDD